MDHTLTTAVTGIDTGACLIVQGFMETSQFCTHNYAKRQGSGWGRINLEISGTLSQDNGW
jgi:hypothetical protein